MEVFTLLTLPNTSPDAFSKYTPSVSTAPIVAIPAATPPPRKIARLHLDDDITSTSRQKQPAPQGPVILTITNRPKAQIQPDPSKEYTAVRRAIQQVLNPDIIPTWTCAEIFEACHHAVCVEGKGQGLHNAARLELRTCAEKMAADILAASSEGLTPIRVVVEKCAWFEKQLALLRSLLTFLDQNYSPPRESIKEIGYALFNQKILESFEITHRLYNSLKFSLTSERNFLNPSSISDEKPAEAATTHSGETHRLLAAFMTQLLTHGHYQSFEEGWIRVSQEYFENESKVCAERWANGDNGNGAPKFYDHVKQRIEQEESRMKSVMPTMSWPKVSQAVVDSLLSGRLEWLAQVVPTYMTNKDLASLENLYQLFVRVNGTKILCAAFKVDVVARVTDIIKDTTAEDTIVQRLLDLKQLCDDGIAKAFVDPKLSSSALEDSTTSTSTAIPAVTYIPNQDFVYAIIDAFALGFKARRNKPAELIAKYINSKMRKGAGGNDAKFNEDMDKVLELHRYTDDKDVFRVFYQRMLAKRLLLERSASDDDERRMLKKLTSGYDPEFGSGEQMFKDLAISRTLMEQFTKDAGRKDATGFGAVVLQQSHWPISPGKIRPLLPNSMQVQLDTYTEFYKKQHKGRALSWNHGYGTASLIGQFDEKPKELSVSLYQALVLLLFNESEELVYTFIAENTGIPDRELKPVLQSLALGKKRVLKKTPAGKDVLDDDVFRFNGAFTDPRPKVHINSIQVKETVEEQQRTESAILEDRKHYLDAALVRIMKAKKELSYNRLVEEAIQAVSKHFMPQPSEIKKRVESLVEQEYMERKADVPGVYVYVA